MMKFISFLLIFIYFLLSEAQKNDQNQASINIDIKSSIAETDDDYICVTMDYFTFIPEAHLSILTIDLNNTILQNAVKAFAPLRLRLGGTLEDVLIYETKGMKQPCIDFVKNTSHTLFGFSDGCLPMARWDQLNHFFQLTGAAVIFGLNALYGKKIGDKNIALGPWDPNNAESLMTYTVSKGYNNIFVWELGNELSGDGVGATILADQYAQDVVALQKLVDKVYIGSKTKPVVAAPGGFFNAPVWFSEFIPKTAKTLPILTHHVYNLGPGEDEHLMERVFDPAYLDTITQTFKDLQTMLNKAGSIAVPWVGEAGGAWHGGRHLVTNSFASSFWYLDQLAIAASYNTKTFCRQTLIGGHYGLLDTTTFHPNPDYYSSLLWHRLMGRRVLATKVTGNPKIRAYSLCSKQPGGITLLILNLDNKAYEINVSTQNGPITGPTTQAMEREEYHLTSSNGDVQSQTMLLNGQVLSLTALGEIPQFVPQKVDSRNPIEMSAFSVVFVQFPGISAPACV
ncbi:hypothetical protein RND81_08G204300 [Saponaria officinalis]|uniref:Uncharacterized protein n=1 Tax=Saponaria officinalis TaxID=3572 RepID=A0AAW1J9Z5_SAPOF